MRSQSAIGSAVTAITTTITVAAGVFAPGHLGELTRIVPFDSRQDRPSRSSDQQIPDVLRARVPLVLGPVALLRRFRGWEAEIGKRELAHQSMTYLWNGRPLEKAVGLSQAAQEAAGSAPSAAGSLAAVMEARAQARLGHRTEALAAVRRSDAMFERLAPAETRVNVLGFYEHLLRFCQSYALTAIGQTGAALEVQQRALELPQANTVDTSLLKMDRATCLISRGEREEGYLLAERTLAEFPIKSRAELVAQRARDILRLTPAGHDHSSKLRELLRSGEFQRQQDGN